MLTRILRFEVRRDAVEEAVKLTASFVDEVRRKEGGTASYHCYQDVADPGRFTHVMAFRVSSAVQYHQGTAWHKKWDAAIRALCVKPPESTEVRELGAA